MSSVNRTSSAKGLGLACAKVLIPFLHKKRCVLLDDFPQSSQLLAIVTHRAGQSDRLHPKFRPVRLRLLVPAGYSTGNRCRCGVCPRLKLRADKQRWVVQGLAWHQSCSSQTCFKLGISGDKPRIYIASQRNTSPE